MNISDHFTRVRTQNNGVSQPILGAIIGIQSGRDIEVFNSYELPFTKGEEGLMELNTEFFTSKQEQCEGSPFNSMALYLTKKNV
jgi:COP9 signalosome complex subunit 6